MIFEQFYLECLSHASYLIGDTSTGRAVVVDPHAPVPLPVVLVPRDLPVDLDVAVVGVHDLFPTADRVRAVYVPAYPAQPVAVTCFRSGNAHFRKPTTC